MSLDAALKAITFAYKSDGAFSSVTFPGDPEADELTDLPEQLNEWPALVIYEDSAAYRMMSHDSDFFWALHTVRIELHYPREAGEGQNRAAEVLRPFWSHVARVFFAGFYGSRFAGTVAALGDPLTRGAQAPLRGEWAPGLWGGVATLSMVHLADIAIQERTAA